MLMLLHVNPTGSVQSSLNAPAECASHSQKTLVLPLGLEQCMGWAEDGNTMAAKENWEKSAVVHIK